MTRKDRYVVLVAALLAGGRGKNFFRSPETFSDAAIWLRQAEHYYDKHVRKHEDPE